MSSKTKQHKNNNDKQEDAPNSEFAHLNAAPATKHMMPQSNRKIYSRAILEYAYEQWHEHSHQSQTENKTNAKTQIRTH